MSLPFSLTDIVYAALLACVFTWLFKLVSRFFTATVTHSAVFTYHPKNLESVRKRCCLLFPNEHIRFNGDVFTRGMAIRMVTTRSKTFEGLFIGGNDENMVCLMTDDTVVAQEVANIEKISPLETRRTFGGFNGS